MNSTVASFCVLLAASTLFAGCSRNASDFPDTIEVGTRPESITKGFAGDYFVTVMGQPGPGDGHVARIRNGAVSIFSEGMDEPKGIAFDGRFLYATDLKRVWKVDAQGQAAVLAAESDFPAPIRFLNDAAIGPDGQSLYVTDMGANDQMWGPDGLLWPLDSEEAANLPLLGRVFRISLPDGAVSIAVDANDMMPCPNGVSFGRDGQMLIGAFFRGLLLELREGELHVVQDGLRGADAVEQDSAGNYYVSSWNQAKVWRIDGQTGEVSVLIEGLKSAADFLMEEDKGRLLLPDMRAGTVTRVDL